MVAIGVIFLDNVENDDVLTRFHDSLNDPGSDKAEPS